MSRSDQENSTPNVGKRSSTRSWPVRSTATPSVTSTRPKPTPLHTPALQPKKPASKPTEQPEDIGTISLLLQQITALTSQVQSLETRFQSNTHATQSNQPKVQPIDVAARTAVSSSTSAVLETLRAKTEQIAELMSQLTELAVANHESLMTLNVEKEALLLQLQEQEATLKQNTLYKEERQTSLRQLQQKLDTTQQEREENRKKKNEENIKTLAKYSEETNSTNAKFQKKIEETKTRHRTLEEEASSNAQSILRLEELQKQRQKEIDDIEDQVRISGKTKNALINTIQELKGTIKVLCRLRPALPGEPTEPSMYQISPQNNREILVEELGQDFSGSQVKKQQTFQFDRVFGPASSQQEIFPEITHMVTNVVEGFTCNIITYGQSGSGKTFTLEGNLDGSNLPLSVGGIEVMLNDNRGLISRAIEQILEDTNRLKREAGWNFEIQMNCVEICGETLFDMFSLSPSQSTTKLEVSNEPNKKRNRITGATLVKVTDIKQCIESLKRASQRRNAFKLLDPFCSASCSSGVLQIFVSGSQNPKNSFEGLLNFIDLSASDKSDPSLSYLTQVITGLASNEKQIPHQKCKLTHILQDSLGGKAKTCFVISVSPNSTHVKESVRCLVHGLKMNSCDLGNARKTSKPLKQ